MAGKSVHLAMMGPSIPSERPQRLGESFIRDGGRCASLVPRCSSGGAWAVKPVAAAQMPQWFLVMPRWDDANGRDTRRAKVQMAGIGCNKVFGAPTASANGQPVTTDARAMNGV
jgi:hypothetical protein